MTNLRLIKNDDSLMTQFELHLANEQRKEEAISQFTKEQTLIETLDAIDSVLLEPDSTDKELRVSALFAAIDRNLIRLKFGARFVEKKRVA